MSKTWIPYAATAAAPWNHQRVVHLHRRGGFAANWTQLQRDLDEGPDAAIERLLEGRSQSAASNFEALAQTIGDAAMASGHSGRLKAWWLFRMLFTPDPLGERLTLMWHNHFATSNRKVQNLVWMRQQNDLLRRHARGGFRDLLHAAVKHPAMLMWLDADSNRKGHPNENLARELMELFTLGIGNYSERDIKEAARALTGWGIENNEFVFQSLRHDDTVKGVLGQRGKMSGEDLLAILVEHPATARRLAWRICRTFLGEEAVDEAAIEELAKGLAARDLNIGWAVETVLRSQVFFSEQNLHSRILGPVEFCVGALRALEMIDPPPSTLLLAEWSARMGQDLFYPPNVGGWNEGRAWLGSRTIVARANFAHALVHGQLWFPHQQPQIESLLNKHGAGGDLPAAVRWLATLLWGGAEAATIEEIVAAVNGQPASGRLGRVAAHMLSRPEHFLA